MPSETSASYVSGPAQLLTGAVYLPVLHSHTGQSLLRGDSLAISLFRTACQVY